MKERSYSYERVRLMPGFDGRECKIYPRPFTECAKYGSDNALWIAKLHFEK